MATRMAPTSKNIVLVTRLQFVQMLSEAIPMPRSIRKCFLWPERRAQARPSAMLNTLAPAVGKTPPVEPT
jgi:hypothetical protein